ncbi:MAG TPA: PmoA family protein [Tepidisphaeraceae bacterium]|nr:PmoA family protein [Tepidisphaeraceae bacterium]
MWWRIALLLSMLVIGLANQAHAQPNLLARLTVDAGDQPRLDTPISIALDNLAISPDGLRLLEVQGDQRLPVPAQLEPGKPPILHWILSGTTPAHGQRVYELSASPVVAAPIVETRQTPTGLDLHWADAQVLHFQSAIMPPPAGADPRYARSGFIHPLRSPAGAVLTNIHPADHIHHLGLWNPWTSTEFEGRHVDFWNIKDGTGTVRFAKLLDKTSGPVFAGFRVAQEHVALNTTAGPKVALNEILDVRVWRVGGPDKGYWLVDYTTTQRCASSSPLKLLAYRYGGIGFRATADWKESNSNYLTSEGKTRKDGHATRARWCAMYGATSQGPAGIEFMSHPKNRQHPEPMRLWPEGDIFFNFCPIQSVPWTLEPGNDYTLRYRLYIYDGTASRETFERFWQDFGNPPQIKLEKP